MAYYRMESGDVLDAKAYKRIWPGGRAPTKVQRALLGIEVITKREYDYAKFRSDQISRGQTSVPTRHTYENLDVIDARRRNPGVVFKHNLKNIPAASRLADSLGAQIDARNAIKAFKESAKKGYVGTKGKTYASAIAQFKKLHDVDQFYMMYPEPSKWYKDDVLEIYYTSKDGKRRRNPCGSKCKCKKCRSNPCACGNPPRGRKRRNHSVNKIDIEIVEDDFYPHYTDFYAFSRALRDYLQSLYPGAAIGIEINPYDESVLVNDSDVHPQVRVVEGAIRKWLEGVDARKKNPSTNKKRKATIKTASFKNSLLDYALDHYDNFQAWPMDFEFKGTVYDFDEYVHLLPSKNNPPNRRRSSSAPELVDKKEFKADYGFEGIAIFKLHSIYGSYLVGYYARSSKQKVPLPHHDHHSNAADWTDTLAKAKKLLTRKAKKLKADVAKGDSPSAWMNPKNRSRTSPRRSRRNPDLPVFKMTTTSGHSWTTDMAKTVTLAKAKKYFLGKKFNVASYPKEKMEKVVKVQKLGATKSNPHTYGDVKAEKILSNQWRVRPVDAKVSLGDIVKKGSKYKATFWLGNLGLFDTKAKAVTAIVIANNTHDGSSFTINGKMPNKHPERASAVREKKRRSNPKSNHDISDISGHITSDLFYQFYNDFYGDETEFLSEASRQVGEHYPEADVDFELDRYSDSIWVDDNDDHPEVDNVKSIITDWLLSLHKKNNPVSYGPASFDNQIKSIAKAINKERLDSKGKWYTYVDGPIRVKGNGTWLQIFSIHGINYANAMDQSVSEFKKHLTKSLKDGIKRRSNPRRKRRTKRR